MADDKLDDLLAEAKKRKADRDAVKDVELKKRELDILLLEEKFESELGARGRMFEIVDAPESPVVLKLGNSVVYKRFRAAVEEGKASLEAMSQYVFPSVVYPDKSVFTEIADARPQVLYRCADALTTLFGAKEENTRSKF